MYTERHKILKKVKNKNVKVKFIITEIFYYFLKLFSDLLNTHKQSYQGIPGLALMSKKLSKARKNTPHDFKAEKSKTKST